MELKFEPIEFLLTKDGSPTAMHLGLREDRDETMHHRDGALAESIYIYDPAIRWGIENKMSPKFLSIGLGLGYVEFLVAVSFLLDEEPRTKNISDNFYLESYEADLTLVKNLLGYLNGTANSFTAVYDLILDRFEHFSSISKENISNVLLEAYDNGSWVIKPALTLETTFSKKFDVILYDLYSSKTIESHWTEYFLNQFLLRAAAPTCAFATYAAKGTLKRSLKNSGFKLENRTGFEGKKESTLAFRLIN